MSRVRGPSTRDEVRNYSPGDHARYFVPTLLGGGVLVPVLVILGVYLFGGQDTAASVGEVVFALLFPTLLTVAVLFLVGLAFDDLE